MREMLVYVRGILTGVEQLSTCIGTGHDNGDRRGVLQSESRYKQLASPLVKKVDKSL